MNTQRLIFTLMLLISCGLVFGNGFQPAEKEVIRVSNSDTGQSLNMPWKNSIAVGRAFLLLREDILSHLEYAQKKVGYKYCRFHAIFDDDMNVVTREKDGTLVFHWTQVDKVYDNLLKLGLKPFVELNPMPAVLASGTQTMFAYEMNVTPPKSYEEWAELVNAFIQHLIERYGRDEIRTWYFEVWNEPNLGAFWSGTKEEYFKLYDTSAFAIKKIDNKLRVGGPASSKANWVLDIINHCHENRIPLDFISTHLYPQDEQVQYPDRKGSPHKIGDFFGDIVKETQALVRNSLMPDLEIHWTEWNTQSAKDSASVTWGENIYVDNLFAASFISRNCIELDKNCNSFCYWVASDIFDEGAIPNSPFSCTYGAINPQGIPKAAMNAFMLLKNMKGNVVETDKYTTTENGRGLLVTKETDTYHIIMWNQNFVENPIQTKWTGSIEIQAESTLDYSGLSATIGAGYGSAWESWQNMGRPLNLSSLQEELLHAHSKPQYCIVNVKPENKNLAISYDLKPGEVQYFEFKPLVNTTQAASNLPEEFKLWDKGMGEKSK